MAATRSARLDSDPEGFEALVRRYTPRMRAVALRYLRDETEAEDVLQEALLAAFRALDRFEGRARFSTWLHRIVVNAALMRLRARMRRREDPIRDGGDALASGARTPEQIVFGRALHRQLRDAVERLPERYRQPILLCYVLELEFADVAGRLGITRSALKMRLHRGRRVLRAELGAPRRGR